MPKLADSHTHLDHFPPEEIHEVLQRALEAHVGLIVCAGTTLVSSRACVDLAHQHELIFAGVGIHPMDLEGPVDDETYNALLDLARDDPKVVCISEVGLDFLPTSPDPTIQYQALRRQVALARELRKPVIFHSRESRPQVLQTLREEGISHVGGVMHYFQGDMATAQKAMDLGLFISMAKPLLRLPELQVVAKDLPLDRMVLETDSAPQPWKKYRRNWTEPSHLGQVAEKLAELKGLAVEEVIERTTNNLLGLLKLDKKSLVASCPPPQRG